MLSEAEDRVLVQNGDSSLGGQRCNSAALHGNAPVSRSSEHRVSGADSLTGQNSDLDRGGLSVNTSHTGGLADTTGLVIPLALAEAFGVDDGHNGDAVGIAQTDKAGSLGSALVAQGSLLGGNDTNGAAVDGSQSG